MRRQGDIRAARRRWLLATVSAGVLAAVQPAWAETDGAAAAQVAQADTAYDMDIPSQPLPQAIADLSAVTGIQVLYAEPSAREHTAPALSGRYTIRQALTRLLAGSGLIARSTAEGAITVERPAGVDDGALMLNPVTVEGQTETALGPVDGYVATRSATGTKTDTPLIETPQSISVVTADQIERQKARSIGDALRYTPGILPSGGAKHTDDGVYMRGFQVNHESFYTDGLRSQSNIYSTATEPYGLERLEVLRGPASVLFGQAGPGGVINMVSKRPTVDPLHELEVQVGSFEQKQIATDHGGALTQDGTFSYRLTALARDGDTTIDHIENDKVFIAPAVTWTPSEDTSLTLLTSYSKSKTAYYYGLPPEGTVLANPNGEIPRERFIGEPDFNDWDRTVVTAGYEFRHDLSDAVEFRQNLRYARHENDYADISFGSWTPGQRVINRGVYARDDVGTMFAVDNQVEARLTTGAVDHTLLAGVDYSRGTLDRLQHSGTVAPLDLYNPVYGSPVTLSATPQFDYKETYDQIGLYAQDQVKVGEKWAFLLGGRQDWVEDKRDDRLTDTETKNDQNAFTWRTGLVYLSETGLAPYVSYAESFQPQTGTTADGASFDPTTGQQYEIGVKYQPNDGNSFITLSAYHLTRQDIPTPDPSNPGFNVQTGEIRSRGVEVDAKLNLFEGFNVLAGYSYTDAEVTESNRGDVGNRPANSPKHMASLWAEYELQDSAWKGLYVGGGVRYVGNTVNLMDTYKAPSYTLVDAAVGYETGPWLLSLNAVNLFDKEYIAGCTYGCFYGDARTVTGTVSYHW